MSALGHTLNPALQRLGEVSVRLSVELGRTQMALKDVLALAEGSVVSLDKLTDELLDITANGQVIAHGEVIAQDGKFALRIVSLAGGDEPVRNPPQTKPSSGPRPDVPPSSNAPHVPPPHVPRGDVSAPGAEAFEAGGQGNASFGANSGPASDNGPASNGEPASPAMPEPGNAPADQPDVDPLLDALDELTDGLGPTGDQSSDGSPDESKGAI